MIERLKQIAARWMDQLPFFLNPPPEDPLAGVRVPRKHGPGGRYSGIALDEPEPDELAGAVGRARRGGQRHGLR